MRRRRTGSVCRLRALQRDITDRGCTKIYARVTGSCKYGDRLAVSWNALDTGSMVQARSSGHRS